MKAIDQLFGQLCNFIVALEDNSVIYTNIKQVVKFMFSSINDIKKNRGTHQFSFQWPYFFTVLLFFCLEGFVLLVGNLWISGVKVVSGTLSMPKSRVLASTNFLVDTGFSLETASIRENIQNCFKNKCI